MPLTHAQIKTLLKRRFPREIVDVFLLPIITDPAYQYDNKETLYAFRPTGYPFDLQYLAGLRWRKTRLSVQAVKDGLALSDEWGADREAVNACMQQYQRQRYFSPPVLIDTKQADIGYVLMDGVHRFAALKKLRVPNHDFWVGAPRTPSRIQRWITSGIARLGRFFATRA